MGGFGRARGAEFQAVQLSVSRWHTYTGMAAAMRQFEAAQQQAAGSFLPHLCHTHEAVIVHHWRLEGLL